jgi:cation diffusion facilitator family transporter
MHITTLDHYRHQHQYYSPDPRSERNTRWVVFLTVSMMVAEIAAGSLFGSMALLADGWHMGTHATALGITLIAYFFARRFANDRRFTFGTGKMGVLGGFSSAIVLLVVALLMGFEAVQRLFSPHPIQYTEAMVVAGIGLCVNLFSALLLKDDHHLSDDHHHDHAHHHPTQSAPQIAPHPARHHAHTTDHNLKAAYLHVLADALTSVLAIVALLAGMFFGWVWMDAVMGLVGAGVITRWSLGLMRETGGILLDQSADAHIIQEIQQCLETDADNRLADLHVWRVSSTQYAGILSLVTYHPKPVDHYRVLLASVDELVHVTIEVHQCLDEQSKVVYG